MWVKLNDADGTYTMCNSFAYLDAGKIVIINVDSDKSKNYNGFKWESDQNELNRMFEENAKYTAAMLDLPGIDA